MQKTPQALKGDTHTSRITDTHEATSGIRSLLPKPIAARLSGPGGLYNAGNTIALTSGLIVAILEARGQASVADAARAYLMGSPGAAWLTGAILIFFVSGEAYHRAWQSGTPIPRLVRLGDLLSAVGAAALTVSLMYFGDVILAIVAGTLLFGGKLGNALAPSGRWPVRFEYYATGETTRTIRFDVFRVAVVLSRFPSLAALAVEIGRMTLQGAAMPGAILPAIMFLCFVIWLCADLMLMDTD